MSGTFPETLRAYRRRAGLSQLALATRAGLDSTTVNRWESGARQPTREHVFAVAVALNLSPRDTDRLLASALYLPGDPLSLLDDDLLVRAARLLAEGNPAQRACLRRGLADALATTDGMLGFRLVGGGR